MLIIKEKLKQQEQTAPGITSLLLHEFVKNGTFVDKASGQLAEGAVSGSWFARPLGDSAGVPNLLTYIAYRGTVIFLLAYMPDLRLCCMVTA